MMEPAEDWYRSDAAHLLDPSKIWSILLACPIVKSKLRLIGTRESFMVQSATDFDLLLSELPSATGEGHADPDVRQIYNLRLDGIVLQPRVGLHYAELNPAATNLRMGCLKR